MIARSLAFRLLVLAVTVTVSVPTALAQDKIELSPFIGIRTAGSFRGENQLISFAMSSSPTFGTFFNYPLVGNLQFEALWSHQSSNVVQKETNIQDPTNPTETELFDTSINYFHGGVLFGGGNETWEPYVALGAGATRFSPDAPDSSSVSKFSFSVGAGLKAYLGERVSFRFDARAFATLAGDRQEDLACGVFGCVSFARASTFWQSHFVGAVMIRF